VSGHHEHDGPACRDVFAKLSEYLDGELPDDLCERVEHHMADCAPCQAFLESLRRTVRWIETADAPAMPDDVRASVRDAYARYRRDRDGG